MCRARLIAVNDDEEPSYTVRCEARACRSARSLVGDQEGKRNASGRGVMPAARSSGCSAIVPITGRCNHDG